MRIFCITTFVLFRLIHVQGTVTHKLIDTKLSELHLQWRPSKDVTIEDVHFRATIVKGYDEFWVGLQKPLINKNASPLTL